MFQLLYEGYRYKTLVSPKYDSLGFFSFNGSYAIIKIGNKYGLINSPWENENEISSVILSPVYNYLSIDYINGVNIIIANKDGKWTYIDKDGKPYIPYIFNTREELPLPSSYMKQYPMDSIPKAIFEIIQNPKNQVDINLSGLNLTFLPKQIGECINAKSLNVEHNRLSYIPKEISNLKI